MLDNQLQQMLRGWTQKCISNTKNHFTPTTRRELKIKTDNVVV